MASRRVVVNTLGELPLLTSQERIRARLGLLQRIEIAKKLLIRFFTSRIGITNCTTPRKVPGLEGAPVETCLRLIRQDHLFKM